MTLQIYWKRWAPNCTAFGVELPMTNDVRNELPAADRPLPDHPNNDIVYTEPDDGSDPAPYMPRHFPVGTWEITAIQEHPPTDNYLYPFYLATDAWQMVDEWLLIDGKYDRPSGRQVRDAGYGAHYPGDSPTTLGCLRVTTEANIRWLAAQVRQEFERKNRVFIQVEV